MNYKKGSFYIIITLCLLLVGFLYWPKQNQKINNKINEEITEEKQIENIIPSENVIKLPEPRKKSNTSLEEALLKRRSIREYKEESLSLEEISQILWAGQGITDPQGLRTAPSAGALYPLEIYLNVSNVNNLKEGIYKYNPQNHELIQIKEGDKKIEIYNSGLQQSAIKNAPLIIIISAVFEKTTSKYGERGIRYVYMEAGHCAQNIYLQATALNLGTVTIGAFDDEKIKQILEFKNNEQPLYLMPIGKIKND
jgi:SagB-type dehydrogenase family enzyme